MRALQTLTDVTSDLLNQNPQVTVEIDRERAAARRITPRGSRTRCEAYNQRQVSTIYTATNEYWVVLEVLPQFQTDIASLDKTVHASTRGTGRPAECRRQFRELGRTGDASNHSGQIPSVTIRSTSRRTARSAPRHAVDKRGAPGAAGDDPRGSRGRRRRSRARSRDC